MALQESLDTLPKGQEGWVDRLDGFPRTYEDSVFDASGDDGLLSPGDTRRLLHQHGVTWEDYTEEQTDGNRHPAILLSFLGY